MIVFIAVAYASRHPSEAERILDPLMAGLRQLGHRCLVVAAGPPQVGDEERGVIRLRSLQLPYSPTVKSLLASLSDPARVVAEVRRHLIRRGADIVVYSDPEWGLGYLHPVVAGIRPVLMLHRMPPNRASRWQRALASAGAVCVTSSHLVGQGRAHLWDTAAWCTMPLPLALVPQRQPVPHSRREYLRTAGPIRIIADPAAGLAKVLEVVPEDFDRSIEVTFVEPDIEARTRADAASRRRAEAACKVLTRRRPQILMMPPLRWGQAPAFLAEAAATIALPGVPADFCRAGATAQVVGTPVISVSADADVSAHHRDDHDPQQRFVALWAALSALLDDPSEYHAAAAMASTHAARHAPVGAATALLAAAQSSPLRWGPTSSAWQWPITTSVSRGSVEARRSSAALYPSAFVGSEGAPHDPR
ncbi:glycosyltransferase [Streptosporangium lutulentum]|uniref:Iron(II)-dependent oxidoreductase n=1 Tax=Streptosporangium lutulentum TaxID=1461250 RepID=A0ABT9QUF2_9ACTN|nr:glycosyltransferase [Streptosporangium lutulentum]MDP9850380.1 iron(II)-dependent oxidoreductase [Streptosporangium lutulentum]